MSGKMTDKDRLDEAGKLIDFMKKQAVYDENSLDNLLAVVTLALTAILPGRYIKIEIS